MCALPTRFYVEALFGVGFTHISRGVRRDKDEENDHDPESDPQPEGQERDVVDTKIKKKHQIKLTLERNLKSWNLVFIKRKSGLNNYE